MFLRLFFITLMFFPLSHAYAEDTAESRNAVIDEILEVSGGNHHFEQLPAMINAGMEQNRQVMDAAVFAKLSSAVNEFHTAQAFREQVKGSFNKHYDKARFAAFLEMIRSPLALKMTQMEKEAATPESLQEMQGYAATLQKNPPAPARRALIEKLDKVTSATQTGMNIQLQIAQTMASVIDPLLPPEQRLKQGQMDDMLWQMQLQVRPMMEQFIHLTMLYAYRSLPDEDLQQYIAFYEADTGKWFIDVMNKATVSAFANLAQKTAERLKEVMPPPASNGS